MLNTFSTNRSHAGAEDILLARLDQCNSMITALLNTFDLKTAECELPQEHMINALDGVRELLDQARQAADQVTRALHQPKVPPLKSQKSP